MQRRLLRGLTPGEIRMASLLFGSAIDWARVHVHGRRYLPLVQPKNCAMTPNGSMYFHPSCFLPDYAAGDPHTIHWFMHEMVHVWQSAHQVSKLLVGMHFLMQYVSIFDAWSKQCEPR
ncbi:hypothetical protein [Massilia sp. Root335]|jgi:hypothetical protein|uniref:hypothetical protein n=1 Tax=Massilia sp. Root335 TaxID=1736517 RepID=UPI00191068D9|nr:hypothetical protein [Massilia sp. Root335]